MNVFMRYALAAAAEAAGDLSEIPVGAVIVRNGSVIATAHNRKEELHDPTAHAEILALRMAAEKISDWRLSDCDLYVTLEPCPMCMAAIREARIRRLYCGAYKPANAPLPKDPEIYYGIEEEACSRLLKDFFLVRRGLTSFALHSYMEKYRSGHNGHDSKS